MLLVLASIVCVLAHTCVHDRVQRSVKVCALFACCLCLPSRSRCCALNADFCPVFLFLSGVFFFLSPRLFRVCAQQVETHEQQYDTDPHKRQASVATQPLRVVFDTDDLGTTVNDCKEEGMQVVADRVRFDCTSEYILTQAVSRARARACEHALTLTERRARR